MNKNNKSKTIFVQIASYRDPQLLPTLDDMFSNADNPDDIYVGIAWQHSEEDEWDNLDKYKIGSNIPLSDDLDSWINFIEGFQRVKTKSDMEQFKNYLCNKFDKQDIVSQNLNIFQNVIKE